MFWLLVLMGSITWTSLNQTGVRGATSMSLQRGQGYQISPKPCWVDGLEGTCMFVYECIKSEGFHIGMCVDSFMFGSCCAHNATENTVLPGVSPSLLYTSPSQPMKRHTTTRPKHSLNKVSSTLRPQQYSTSLKLRPATQNAAQAVHTFNSATQSVRPMSTDSLHPSNSIIVTHYTKPQWSTKPSYQPYPSTTTKLSYSPGWHVTTEPGFITGNGPTNSHHQVQTQKWSVTTEPGFVTKVKQKPVASFKPKPTKKPIGTTQKGTLKPTKTTTTIRTTTVPTTVSTTTTIKNLIYNNVGGGYVGGDVGNVGIVDVISGLNTVTAGAVSSSVTVSTSTLSSISSHGQKVSAVNSDPLLATSTFSSVSASNAESVGCGQPPLFPQPQTRIVGGRNAPFGRWPWQVSVRRTSFFGFSSTHRCGGAILNENWIATAGHCVDDLLTSQIRIRVGEYDFSSVQEELPYVERAVARKVVHPKYNFFTYEYDLALVQLDKALEFAPHISPICLPASDDLLIGENATVTGWGRLSEGGTLPSILQEVQVPIVSNERCKSMFLKAGRHEFIPEIFLCAGHENGGRDSCQGDSGGPLQVRGKDGRYFLAGIISWGIGCAEANLPGVCTRISKFVPWILNNVT